MFELPLENAGLPIAMSFALGLIGLVVLCALVFNSEPIETRLNFPGTPFISVDMGWEQSDVQVRCV